MTKWALFAAAGIAIAATAAESQNAEPRTYNNPAWTAPVQPFKMADRLYYVGSGDLAAYLIDTGKGLILLDTGVPEYAPTLLANVRALGFDPKNIEILLNSHAHIDHAGGHAAVKEATGARLLSSEADAPLLERGGRDDFAWGDDLSYPAAKVDGLVRDGQQVRLGAVTLTAHIMPGHTKGCTTWTMPIRDGGRTRIAQFNCSMSAPGYRLLATPAYPNMVADYEKSFRKVRTLTCDFFFSGHASAFAMEAKRAKLGQAGANPFVDPAGCKRYIDDAEAAYRQRLAREQNAARAGGQRSKLYCLFNTL